MIALCDCNNFYVSCERAFDPSLKNKPVAILSNNDGCIISRSNEVKDLGIKMAQPAFFIKEKIKKHNIQLYSSNYALYGDMSERVMNILGRYSNNIEIYSIDEAFMDLSGIDKDLDNYSEEIIRTIKQWTGIPTSIGIAPTKTLAKIANSIAKTSNKPFVIDSPRKADISLRNTLIEDVWGVGRQYANMLNKNGIHTAYDLTKMPDNWVRKNMTIMGLRTKKELLGEPCIKIENQPQDKKAICTSRAFGKKITDFKFLEEAVSTYATRCAEKLRKQNTVANLITVFIHTDPFTPNEPQYQKSKTIQLPIATNSNKDLIHYALILLNQIFADGYKYKKAGVIVDGLSNKDEIQANLFKELGTKKDKKLMETIDLINSYHGKDKIRLAIMGDGKEWKLRQQRLSGSYTTKWEDLVVVKLTNF
jgi:DNA polymerase V